MPDGLGIVAADLFIPLQNSRGGFLDRPARHVDHRPVVLGEHAARVGAIFYRRLNDLAVLPAFAGFSLEIGDVFQTRSDISLSDARVGGSFWLGVDTPIGPVYGAYGRAEGGEGAFYLFLGRIF